MADTPPTIICIWNDEDNPDGPQGYVYAKGTADSRTAYKEIEAEYAAYKAADPDADLNDFVYGWLVPHGYVAVAVTDVYLPW